MSHNEYSLEPESYADYDPSTDQGDLPYIPSLNPTASYNKPAIPMKPITEGYVDMDNLQQYVPQKQENAKDSRSVYAEQLNNVQKKPTFEDAGSKMQAMSDVLGQLNNIIGETPNNQGRPSNAPTMQKQTNQQRPPIDVTIMTMKKTLEYLRNVNLWLPESKKEYSQKLLATANPIVKALDAYVSIIEKMK